MKEIKVSSGSEEENRSISRESVEDLGDLGEQMDRILCEILFAN